MTWAPAPLPLKDGCCPCLPPHRNCCWRPAAGHEILGVGHQRSCRRTKRRRRRRSRPSSRRPRHGCSRRSFLAPALPLPTMSRASRGGKGWPQGSQPLQPTASKLQLAADGCGWRPCSHAWLPAPWYRQRAVRRSGKPCSVRGVRQGGKSGPASSSRTEGGRLLRVRCSPGVPVDQPGNAGLKVGDAPPSLPILVAGRLGTLRPPNLPRRRVLLLVPRLCNLDLFPGVGGPRPLADQLGDLGLRPLLHTLD